MSDQKIIPPGKLINEYEIVDLHDIGGYASIYKVKDTRNNQLYAMKTELINSEIQTLPTEIECMQHFQEDFFPKLISMGNNKEFNINYYVMDLLGASIETIQLYHRKKLDMNTVYNICFNMLLIIQAFHSYGYVHRDIKPGNFLIQKNESCPLVLIDFGICQKHIDPNTNKPYPRSSEKYFFGTERFSSIDSCRGYTQGRKDDLMSWFYTFLELSCGFLPWDKAADFTDMLFVKKFLNISYLHRKFPSEMNDIYKYIKKLSYYDDPNYGYILQLYAKAMEKDKCVIGQFNWNAFYQQHSNLETLTKYLSLQHYKKVTEYNQIKEKAKNQNKPTSSFSHRHMVRSLSGQTKLTNKSSRTTLNVPILKNDKRPRDIKSEIILDNSRILGTDKQNSKDKVNNNINNMKKKPESVQPKNTATVEETKDEEANKNAPKVDVENDLVNIDETTNEEAKHEEKANEEINANEAKEEVENENHATDEVDIDETSDDEVKNDEVTNETSKATVEANNNEEAENDDVNNEETKDVVSEKAKIEETPKEEEELKEEENDEIQEHAVGNEEIANAEVNNEKVPSEETVSDEKDTN